MAFDSNLTNLNYVLAGLYPVTSESYRIVDAAGLPRIQIAFRERAIDNWYSILDEADKRGRVLDVIRAARRDFPDNPFLERAEAGSLTTVSGPLLGKELTWAGQEPGESLEKLMGDQSTFLPIAFLERGMLCARSVALVQLAIGESGSGFLTKDNFFITNNHVIPNEDSARSAVIQFNYQKSATGTDLTPVDFHPAPDQGFATSIEHDWTLVKLDGDPNVSWGSIPINQVQIRTNDRVNIIQHPGGGPKQIALYHNIVAYADDNRVQYLTDTMPGSSGSPVFDSQWRLVALHHSGGWIIEPGTKKQVFRNEGININCIIRGAQQSGLLT